MNQCLLFDNDGTLEDSERLCNIGLVVKFRELGVKLGTLRLSHLFSVFSEKASSKASLCRFFLIRAVGTFRKVTTQGVTFSERPEGRGLKALSLC
jgi:hypothetical protein